LQGLSGAGILARHAARGGESLEPDALARLVFEAMSDKLAEDLVILDIRPVSLISDYFVIGTVDSDRQLRAVVQGVTDTVRESAGAKPVAVEGEPESGWVLVDFGDVVAHVFDEPRRQYYDLESVWRDAALVARMR
jgi:ribosome-associated protein